MQGILDRLALATERFAPSSVRQYLALQIARKMADLPRVRTYVALAEKYSPEALVALVPTANEQDTEARRQGFWDEIHKLNTS